MLSANHILRSLVIGPGLHRVEVEYRPASYQIGLYLSCVALAALFGLFFGLRKGRNIPIKVVPVGVSLLS